MTTEEWPERNNVAGTESGEGDPKPRNGPSLYGWKSQGTDSFLELPKGNAALFTS